ncbi:hypothetical protein JOB18_018329 [Solea senegalensis]|uniref:Uncharacterized protein n=1 Tax=Solea senegalensis TaxID=28829 RepID=A0AAV6R5I3_SOLSE|nr:hypothetical protein JOB18_018329 [Solea senegalensis]
MVVCADRFSMPPLSPYASLTFILRLFIGNIDMEILISFEMKAFVPPTLRAQNLHMLSDEFEILIFCSTDVNNLNLEMLVQPREPCCRRGFSSRLVLDMAPHLLCLLSSASTFTGIAANTERRRGTNLDGEFKRVIPPYPVQSHPLIGFRDVIR